MDRICINGNNNISNNKNYFFSRRDIKSNLLNVKTCNNIVFTNNILHNKKEYFINRNQPLVKEILTQISDKRLSKKIEILLRLIEDHIPVDTIFSDFNSDPKSFEKETLDLEKNKFGIDLVSEFTKFFEKAIKEGLNKEEAFAKTLSIEPFNGFAAQFESMKDIWISQ